MHAKPHGSDGKGSFESAASSLTQAEVERFSRQIMVEGIGAAGMARIRQGTVCCVGAGGLGSTIALYLAAAGVGRLILVDYDDVEVSNLHRQVIHTTDRVGTKKVDSARASCQAIDPAAVVETVPEALSVGNALDILRRCDVVVDGSDNVAARYLINDAAMWLRKPLVSGSAMRWEGQLTVYGFTDGPCYRCLFPQPPPPAAVGSCNDSGVIGPVPGMIGCLQALEVLKILAGAGEPLSGRMLLFDGLRLTMRVAKLRPRQADTCPACGDQVRAASSAASNTSSSFMELARSRPEYVPADSCSTGAVIAGKQDALPTAARCSPRAFAANFVATKEPDVRRGRKRSRDGEKNAPDAVAKGGGDESYTEVGTASTGPTRHAWSLCVDVRASIQYDMCHLPRSNSLPLSELQRWDREGTLATRWNEFILSALKTEERAPFIHAGTQNPTLLAALDTLTVYVICRRGVASVQATQLLLSRLGTEGDGNALRPLHLGDGRVVSVTVVNVDGGLNAYHTQVDETFPFY